MNESKIDIRTTHTIKVDVETNIAERDIKQLSEEINHNFKNNKKNIEENVSRPIGKISTVLKQINKDGETIVLTMSKAGASLSANAEKALAKEKELNRVYNARDAVLKRLEKGTTGLNSPMVDSNIEELKKLYRQIELGKKSTRGPDGKFVGLSDEVKNKIHLIELLTIQEKKEKALSDRQKSIHNDQQNWVRNDSHAQSERQKRNDAALEAVRLRRVGLEKRLNNDQQNWIRDNAEKQRIIDEKRYDFLKKQEHQLRLIRIRFETASTKMKIDPEMNDRFNKAWIDAISRNSSGQDQTVAMQKLVEMTKEVQVNFAKAHNAVGFFEETLKRLPAVAARVIDAFIVYKLLSEVVALLSKGFDLIINQSIKIGDFERRISGISGSSFYAKQTIDKLQISLSTLPITFDETANATQVMLSRGLNPTNRALTAMVAASKGLTDPLEGIIDQVGRITLSTGTSVRGIKNLGFTFQEYSLELDKTKDKQEALLNLFERKYGKVLNDANLTTTDLYQQIENLIGVISRPITGSWMEAWYHTVVATRDVLKDINDYQTGKKGIFSLIADTALTVGEAVGPAALAVAPTGPSLGMINSLLKNRGSGGVAELKFKMIQRRLDRIDAERIDARVSKQASETFRVEQILKGIDEIEFDRRKDVSASRLASASTGKPIDKKKELSYELELARKSLSLVDVEVYNKNSIMKEDDLKKMLERQISLRETIYSLTYELDQLNKTSSKERLSIEEQLKEDEWNIKKKFAEEEEDKSDYLLGQFEKQFELKDRINKLDAEMSGASKSQIDVSGFKEEIERSSRMFDGLTNAALADMMETGSPDIDTYFDVEMLSEQVKLLNAQLGLKKELISIEEKRVDFADKNKIMLDQLNGGGNNYKIAVGGADARILQATERLNQAKAVGMDIVDRELGIEEATNSLYDAQLDKQRLINSELDRQQNFQIRIAGRVSSVANRLIGIAKSNKDRNSSIQDQIDSYRTQLDELNGVVDKRTEQQKIEEKILALQKQQVGVMHDIGAAVLQELEKMIAKAIILAGVYAITGGGGDGGGGFWGFMKKGLVLGIKAGIGFLTGGPAGAAIGASGGFINAIGSQEAANGFHGITTKPTTFRTSEKGHAERIDITPITEKNNSMVSSGGITFNFTGNVYGIKHFRELMSEAEFKAKSISSSR